jgi:uncharacterized protein with HEPN domain
MERDSSLLLDILIACRKIQQYTANVDWEAFQQNSILQDAVLRQLEIIGEAARRISQQTRDNNPEIAWSAIVGMRNRLIDEYNRVDFPIVWNAVQIDIPCLISQIEQLVPPEE